MQFSRSKFYHRRAGLPRLDLAMSGCETQFISGEMTTQEKRPRIRIVLEMIKFEHSVFALPFALTGALLAARATRNGWPTLRQLLWIVVAMVAARAAAMTMNRIVDVQYDRENPRTKQRALVTGALTLKFAWVFTLLAVAVFFVAAWQLNS